MATKPFDGVKMGKTKSRDFKIGKKKLKQNLKNIKMFEEFVNEDEDEDLESIVDDIVDDLNTNDVEAYAEENTDNSIDIEVVGKDTYNLKGLGNKKFVQKVNGKNPETMNAEELTAFWANFVKEGVPELQEAAKPETVFIIKRTSSYGGGRPDRDKYVKGTLADLINYFGYTLEIGHSWKKSISLEPKNIKSFVKNLQDSYEQKEANLYNRTSIDLVTEVPEGGDVSDQTLNK